MKKKEGKQKIASVGKDSNNSGNDGFIHACTHASQKTWGGRACKRSRGSGLRMEQSRSVIQFNRFLCTLPVPIVDRAL